MSVAAGGGDRTNQHRAVEGMTVAEQYNVINTALTEHSWSRTAVLHGQFCVCGYNGDHRNHLVLSIIRALVAAAVSSLPTTTEEK